MKDMTHRRMLPQSGVLQAAASDTLSGKHETGCRKINSSIETTLQHDDTNIGGDVSKWRGLHDYEFEELQSAAKNRAVMTDSEQKRSLSAPEAAENSISGALYWAWVVLRQDRPGFIFIAIMLLLWQAARLMASLFGLEML